MPSGRFYGVLGVFAIKIEGIGQFIIGEKSVN